MAVCPPHRHRHRCRLLERKGADRGGGWAEDGNSTAFLVVCHSNFRDTPSCFRSPEQATQLHGDEIIPTGRRFWKKNNNNRSCVLDCACKKHRQALKLSCRPMQVYSMMLSEEPHLKQSGLDKPAANAAVLPLSKWRASAQIELTGIEVYTYLGCQRDAKQHTCLSASQTLHSPGASARSSQTLRTPSSPPVANNITPSVSPLPPPPPGFLSTNAMEFTPLSFSAKSA